EGGGGGAHGRARHAVLQGEQELRAAGGGPVDGHGQLEVGELGVGGDVHPEVELGAGGDPWRLGCEPDGAGGRLGCGRRNGGQQRRDGQRAKKGTKACPEVGGAHRSRPQLSTLSPDGSRRNPRPSYRARAPSLVSWVFTTTRSTRHRRSQRRASITSAWPRPWRRTSGRTASRCRKPRRPA